jgi:hypothetical protein
MKMLLSGLLRRAELPLALMRYAETLALFRAVEIADDLGLGVGRVVF